MNYETKSGMEYALEYSYDSIDDDMVFTVKAYILNDKCICAHASFFVAKITTGSVIPKNSKHMSSFDIIYNSIFECYANNKKINEFDNFDAYVFSAVEELVKKNGWKSMDEYIEKRVFPFFYAHARHEEIRKDMDAFMLNVVSPLKRLEEEIVESRAQKKCILEEGDSERAMIQAKIDPIDDDVENALLKLFKALRENEKIAGEGFFTKLRKAWNRDQKNWWSREFLIYIAVYPSKFNVMGLDGGFNHPQKLRISDIQKSLSCMTNGGCCEEIKTLRRVCKAMKIDLDTKAGRRKN